MNISFKDLQKKFSRKGSKTLIKPFSPETDWLHIVVTFTIVNILIIGWSAYVFFFAQLDTLTVEEDQSIAPAVSMSSSTVTTVLSSFQTKAAQTNIILQQKPTIADPS